jgi:hypothetical protein
MVLTSSFKTPQLLLLNDSYFKGNPASVCHHHVYCFDFLAKSISNPETQGWDTMRQTKMPLCLKENKILPTFSMGSVNYNQLKYFSDRKKIAGVLSGQEQVTHSMSLSKNGKRSSK